MFEHVPKEYSIFGMSRIVGMESNDSEPNRFLLFPRSLDNSTYFNSAIIVNGEYKHLMLYYNEKFSDFGIRVTNLKCYQQLINSFARSMLNIIALVENDSKRNVILFGEILIADREISKRWRESG